MIRAHFVVFAAGALVVVAAFCIPVEVTAKGLGSHSPHVATFKFRPSVRHPRRDFRPGAFTGPFAGYPGYYYWPTYSTQPVIEESVPLRIDPVIPPPEALTCTRNRETITVPAEAGGSAKQITITRC